MRENRDRENRNGVAEVRLEAVAVCGHEVNGGRRAACPPGPLSRTPDPLPELPVTFRPERSATLVGVFFVHGNKAPSDTQCRIALQW